MGIIKMKTIVDIVDHARKKDILNIHQAVAIISAVRYASEHEIDFSENEGDMVGMTVRDLMMEKEN
jgi:hypothetical protein